MNIVYTKTIFDTRFLMTMCARCLYISVNVNVNVSVCVYSMVDTTLVDWCSAVSTYTNTLPWIWAAHSQTLSCRHQYSSHICPLLSFMCQICVWKRILSSLHLFTELCVYVVVSTCRCTREFVCPWINGKNKFFFVCCFFFCIFSFWCVIRYTALSLYLSLFIFSVVLEVNEVLFSFLLWARVHSVKRIYIK